MLVRIWTLGDPREASKVRMMSLLMHILDISRKWWASDIHVQRSMMVMCFW